MINQPKYQLFIIKQQLLKQLSPCGSTMTCLCAKWASRPFSFLPNSRPMEDLIPFFFGCLCRESWLLVTLLKALASASSEATILITEINRQYPDFSAKCFCMFCSWLFIDFAQVIYGSFASFIVSITSDAACALIFLE